MRGADGKAIKCVVVGSLGPIAFDRRSVAHIFALPTEVAAPWTLQVDSGNDAVVRLEFTLKDIHPIKQAPAPNLNPRRRRRDILPSRSSLSNLRKLLELRRFAGLPAG